MIAFTQGTWAIYHTSVQNNISHGFMSNFNLRLSFRAYFLPADSYPHVCLNVRLLLVLRSIASLCCHYNDHITRMCTRLDAATQAGESRCPISPRGCRRWKKFCRFSDVEKTLAIVIGGSISAPREHYEDVDRWCEYSSYRIRAQVAPAIYIAVRYGVSLEWQK